MSRRNKPANQCGCKPSEDVCLAHDLPLECRHGCQRVKPHRCKEYREFLGRYVRMVWEEWAREQPNPKPSWLTSWDELTEPEREVDRRIGERIAALFTIDAHS